MINYWEQTHGSTNRFAQEKQLLIHLCKRKQFIISGVYNLNKFAVWETILIFRPLTELIDLSTAREDQDSCRTPFNLVVMN